jgi:hypothetical protein
MADRHDDRERRWRRYQDEERFNREGGRGRFDEEDWRSSRFRERGFQGRPENPYDQEGRWGRGRYHGGEDWRDYYGWQGSQGYGDEENWRERDYGRQQRMRGEYARQEWQDRDRDYDRDFDREFGPQRMRGDYGRQEWQDRDRDFDRQQRMRGRQDWGERDFDRDYEGGRMRGDWDRQGFRYGQEDEYYGTEEPFDWSYTEVWMIEGPYMGVGPQGYQRSDDRIFEEICERLTQHGRIDARDIKVEIRNGEVTLQGTVDNRHTKRMVEDVVDTVTGVHDIHNRLKVKDDRKSQERQHRMGMDKMGMEKKDKIRQGMKVFTSDDQEIGEVKEVRDHDFLVDRPMARDIYVPLDACENISHERIHIGVPENEIGNQGWENPELIDTGTFRNE